MKKVLVLCTGNSCRSIMAEALINQLGEGQFEAVQRGQPPDGLRAPQVAGNPAPARHRRSGSPRSKSWDDFAGQPLRLRHHGL